MNKRIFVEKKSNFNIKAQALVKELKHNLQLTSLTDLRIVQVYDVFGLADSLFERAEKHIFSEQVTDNILAEDEVVAELANYAFFAIESLPGQFDQRAASSQEALLLLGSSSDVTVNTAQLYLVNKDIDAVMEEFFIIHFKEIIAHSVIDSTPSICQHLMIGFVLCKLYSHRIFLHKSRLYRMIDS